MSWLIFVGFLLVYNAEASPSLGSRIVGGEETIIELHPYQAALQFRRGSQVFSHCGASIISTKFLLTAAHCEPIWPHLFFARVGSTYFNEGGQLLKIESFIQHPKYFRPNLDYDFAIAGFADGVEIVLSPNALIAQLAPMNAPDPPDGSLVCVSGWGYVDEIRPDTEVLRKVNLPVFNSRICEKLTAFWTPRHLCLGGTPDGYLSACFGDSGGPAMQNGIQYALVSGGSSCFAPGEPGIYSKISQARDWIDEVVNFWETTNTSTN